VEELFLVVGDQHGSESGFSDHAGSIPGHGGFAEGPERGFCD
jgi:hypothetical protein